jgi:hypothetical protein
MGITNNDQMEHRKFVMKRATKVDVKAANTNDVDLTSYADRCAMPLTPVVGLPSAIDEF